MAQCAFCKIHACSRGDAEHLPEDCPGRQQELEQAAAAVYEGPELHAFARNAALVEAEGYGEWPRVREIMEFARKMGYKRLGLAFCIGLAREAEVCAGLLLQAGFEVESVACKNGGIPKRVLDVQDEQQVRPGQPEVMCNPVGQARLLERAGTEFNIALGLCVGHDSMFFQHSHVPVTVLVAKDRALGHNPVAALNPCNRYLAKRLLPTDCRPGHKGGAK